MFDAITGFLSTLFNEYGFGLFWMVGLTILVFRMKKRRAQRDQAMWAALSPEVMEACTARATPERLDAARMRVFPDQDGARVERMFRQFGFAFAADGSFVTHPDAAAIESLVSRIFAPEHQDAVQAELARYGTRDFEQMPERIRLDIIKMSDGDPAKVQELVKVAKCDFRDLPLMAENPGFYSAVMKGSRDSIKAVADPLSDRHRAVQDEDLRQFGVWLLQYVE